MSFHESSTFLLPKNSFRHNPYAKHSQVHNSCCRYNPPWQGKSRVILWKKQLLTWEMLQFCRVRQIKALGHVPQSGRSGNSQ